MFNMYDACCKINTCGCTTRASVAEVAISRLLEVEGVLLDSLVSAVLALNGVTRHVVWVCPGFSLLDAG